MQGIEPDLKLPDLDLPGRKGEPPRGQAEFVQTPGDYIREGTIARLAERGKKLAAEHRAMLAAIEQKFGVPSNVILAIWGRETAFGGYKLPHNAIRVLATQGYYGRRKDRVPRGIALCAARLWTRAMSSLPTCAAPGPAPWD